MNQRLLSRTAQTWLHAGLGLAWAGWVVSLIVCFFSLPLVSGWTHALIGPQQHHDDAKRISAWVAGGDAEAKIPLGYRAGKLTPKEQDHYTDVRRLLRWNRTVTGVGFSLLLLLGLSQAGRKAAVAAAGIALWEFFILLAIAVVWAVVHWRSLFAFCHNLFFAEGSWRLPKNSVSLQLFPQSYWQEMFGLVLFGAALVILVGWAWARHCRSAGAPITSGTKN